MDEKELKRIVFIDVQGHLERAKEACEKSEELKGLFGDKIEALLKEVSEEMLRQQIY